MSDLLPGVQVRHCAHCGDQFTTRHQAQYFCSVRCRREGADKSPALAAALSALAEPVPGAPAGLLGVAARIETLPQHHVEQLLQLTGRLLAR